MSDIAGHWRIESMEMWSQDFVDAEVPGYIEFSKNGLGSFQFGYVRCDIDWVETDSQVEFAFSGFDEMEPCSGRGSATFQDGKLTGELAFHHGDTSGFVAAPT